MKKKVYCGECEHHAMHSIDKGNYDHEVLHKCLHVKKLVDTPICKVKVYNECHEDNKRNNCKDYKKMVYKCVYCNKELVNRYEVCDCKKSTSVEKETTEHKPIWKFWK